MPCARYTQIGVVSYGNGCADAAFPGVYARVTQVISWIKQIAAEAQHSNCQLSASGIATLTQILQTKYYLHRYTHTL